MEAWLEEMTAIYDKNILPQLYHMATDKPFCFRYIKVNAKDKKKKNVFFFDSLQNMLVPKTITNDEELNSFGTI